MGLQGKAEVFPRPRRRLGGVRVTAEDMLRAYAAFGHGRYASFPAPLPGRLGCIAIFSRVLVGARQLL